MYECKIAEKLVKLRTSKGVTQEEVARSLSVSNKTVSKWENGASMPDLPMLVGLANYYGITTDALLGLSEEKKRSTREEVCSSFKGLDRRESVLKAFESVKSIIPAMFGTISAYEDIKALTACNRIAETLRILKNKSRSLGAEECRIERIMS